MTEAHHLFLRHVAEYNLTYATLAEYEARLEIFSEKHAFIEAHNSRSDVSYTMAHNHMSTWTDAEYSRLLGFRGRKTRPRDWSLPGSSDILPTRLCRSS